MEKRQVVAYGRIIIGLLVFVAIATQIIYLTRHGAFNPANFFSYFTNLGNMFAATVFLVTGTALLGKAKSSTTEDGIRAANTLILGSVGIVYVTLLSEYDLGLLLPWVNIVMHYFMPLAVLADWLVWPPQMRLGIRQLMWWLLIPIGYLVYTLARGAIVGWYPYPFLDPDKQGGYGRVTLYCVAIAIGMILLLLLVRWVGNSLGGGLKSNRKK